jgi:D-allose transport system ATP-binding protein
MAYITENRRSTGFFHNFSIKKNIAQSKHLKRSSVFGIVGVTHDQEEDQWANKGCEMLDVKCASINQSITELSGGNQQKVIIARSLIAESQFFIFDEPTRGIDVGAKNEIYKIMRQLAEEGKGVLMVSSELPELLSNCDRIVVFNQGEIRAILPNHEATEERIMAYATE